MRKIDTFVVTDYSALHGQTKTSFSDAVTLARRYSAEGGGTCPATIIDIHGCRWNVYGNGPAELMECPAITAGHAAQCDCSWVPDADDASGPGEWVR